MPGCLAGAGLGSHAKREGAAQIREDLRARRERFGLSYLVAPDRDLPVLAEVIAGL